MTFGQIADVIDKHLFETLEEMKVNIAKDLDIPEEQVTFKKYADSDRTEVCVTKNGKQVYAYVEGSEIK